MNSSSNIIFSLLCLLSFFWLVILSIVVADVLFLKIGLWRTKFYLKRMDGKMLPFEKFTTGFLFGFMVGLCLGAIVTIYFMGF